MGILIANIGTSDLAIKVEVNGKQYYLPIDPLNEPNQDKSGLTSKELSMWEKPHHYFRESGLYAELGFSPEVQPSSRELTEKLLEFYKNNSEYWHPRIFPPRIWGVVEQAISMGINQAYIFVTNQTIEQIRPEVRDKDTVHLYEILKSWFQQKLPNFTLISEPIDENIPLNDADLLFKVYFNFFNRLRREEEQSQQQQKHPQLGDTLLGKIVDFDKLNQGIFVEIHSGKRGFIHISNISHELINPDQVRNIFKLGDSICVELIKREGSKLKFSTKELEDDPGEMLRNPKAVYERIKPKMTLDSQSNPRTQLEEELMLISVKGGTNQMKTALQLQGISVSAVKRLLFVNPKLAIPNVFAGLPSNCELESYWRYMRTQKYQTVRLLLERWDFDGAIQILQNWQDYLEYLINQGIIDKKQIEKSSNISKFVITALDFARGSLNLDFQTAKNIAQTGIKTAKLHLELNQDSFPQLFQKLDTIAEEYKYSQYRLLNLYTQNRIYWKLNEIASFLSHISSLYEEVLRELILKWVGTSHYLFKDKFDIDVPRLKTTNKEVWNIFADLERKGNPSFKYWEKSSTYKYRLTSRYSKRNFAEALTQVRNNANDLQAWNSLCNALKQLDYWSDKRNELIHSAKGFSKQLMQELQVSHIPKPHESKACLPDDILDVMAAIMKNNLVDLKTVYRNNFLGEDAQYYIYSTVREWVIKQLVDDGLQ
ncbi:S1 RNA-binding domain-containing protein [Tolypothrix sp. VBCCA 56010]|uniref:S1 RNA-binding domain-containing protein n=1 Tax=Tolypothrix sp. VBCCA 56010 TaxID=3137731 RepID=UPI003D7E865C